MGDIWASYGTEGGGTETYLYSNLGGSHNIRNTGVSIYPEYWYTYDNDGNFVSKTQHGYAVNAYVSGLITASPTLADVGNRSQSNQFNARGINLYENVNAWTYKSYQNYDNNGIGIGPYELFSNASTSVTLSNFSVSYANGWYNEYTHGDYGGLGSAMAAGGQDTYFNYSVTWHGDFLPGTVPSGFVAPAISADVSAVPEPSVWAMLFSGVIGVAVAIRRRLK